MQNEFVELLQKAIGNVLGDTAVQQITTTQPSFILDSIDIPKQFEHGEFASNIALLLAKRHQRNPRELAQALVEHMQSSIASLPWLDRIEIAGPGFLNVYLSKIAYKDLIQNILNKPADFGHSQLGAGKRILLEYVSANPTGPLHVGHGRSAAIGSVLARILSAAGFNVHREYYVNDAGRQMDILATSVFLRYLERCRESFPFPSNGYKGDYIIVIANSVYDKIHDRYHVESKLLFTDIPADAVLLDSGETTGDKEAHIDALIARAKQSLGPEGYDCFFQAGMNDILNDIKADLTDFRVTFDEWFHERQLEKNNDITKGIDKLKAGGYTYLKDGALWFKSTEFGDEKDRVLIRDNGAPTYFASDVAYHLNKAARTDLVIDMFGADHHGYLPRLRAIYDACGVTPNPLSVILVQFATLYRHGEKVQMSSRSGEFVTLRQLREEVGTEATRFFYVMRKADQHVDFDLDLAKSQSQENPIYYVQYAHARICRVFEQLTAKGRVFNPSIGIAESHRLTEQDEQLLTRTVLYYPITVEKAALYYEPHRLAQYLRDLAHAFHRYYNTTPFIVDDEPLMQARLALIKTVQTTLKNGLQLMDIDAVEQM